MKGKIWRVLTQLLCNRNGSSDCLKPFFENLNNENINDKRNFSLLQSFSKYQLEVLYNNHILSEENFLLLI